MRFTWLFGVLWPSYFQVMLCDNLPITRTQISSVKNFRLEKMHGVSCFCFVTQVLLDSEVRLQTLRPKRASHVIDPLHSLETPTFNKRVFTRRHTSQKLGAGVSRLLPL
jgi:hypothetical protein